MRAMKKEKQTDGRSMASDLENDHVIRTKRARRCRSVFFHRSTWAVSPVSFPTAVCCSSPDDRSIHFQKVGEAVALPIPLWNGLPQLPTRLFAPISHGIGDYLPRPAAESNPNPGVVRFFEDKRPEFVQFQGCGCGILWVRGEQSGPQRRKLRYFFLIQPDTVVRETPKVRVRPRKLLRS
jgi:hypothetical protein